MDERKILSEEPQSRVSEDWPVVAETSTHETEPGRELAGGLSGVWVFGHLLGGGRK